MKIFEYYKNQLEGNRELLDQEILNEYYNLSRFLNHSVLENCDIQEHIESKIVSYSNEKIGEIAMAAKLVKAALKKVIPIIEAEFKRVELVDVIIMIGDGYIDGHGIIANSKPYMIIDIGTVSESIEGYDLEVFLIHEIIHALHYYESPSMYFRNYVGIFDDYIKRLVSEGIATYVTGRLHGREMGLEYWLGHFTSEETNEWINLCEKKKNEVSYRLNVAIQSNAINYGLYYELFSVVDPDYLMESRVAYYYGSKVCESLSKNIKLNELLVISAEEWSHTVLKYFEIDEPKDRRNFI